MFTIKNIGGNKLRKTVYSISDFPYEKYENMKSIGKKKRYVDCICTFDIETTSMRKEECGIFDHDFAFMYVWQFCINGDIIMGRTWDEYSLFLDMLHDAMNTDGLLVIFVHNLAFEFQFFRNFFEIREVFARKSRNALKVTTDTCEYRCTLALSNMGLEKFLKNGKNVQFQKMSGKDFDYTVKRFPDTPLTEAEYGYCICDVMGLYERMKEMLEEDDLTTLPMTSTGYVRRDYREKVLANPKNRQKLLETALNTETYCACYEAVRGGISGSNFECTGYTLYDMDGFDIKSSYPYQMMVNYYPCSKFLKYTVEYDCEKFRYLLDNFCCIILWEAKNVKLKHWETIPYIAKDKCRAIDGGKFGNGKVYFAERLGMRCTEIDFKIIETHYYMEDIKIHEIYVSERDFLPKEFREHLGFMFQEKTNLEDGDPYMYMKYKNRINGSFGMMLTNILNDEIIYEDSAEPWRSEPIQDYEKALRRYYGSKNSFLCYQHGVWVTAHARKALMEGIDLAGDDIVQVDTDSVKCLGKHKEGFEAINKRIIDKAEKYDVKPYAIKHGKKHYLGVWEHECHYDSFKTWGAKKYAYTIDGKTHITVAGLNPKLGAQYVDENGGLDDAFNVGVEFTPKYSGRSESHYHDITAPVHIIVQGHDIITGSSIAIFESSYTLGITNEWNDLINGNCLDTVGE